LAPWAGENTTSCLAASLCSENKHEEEEEEEVCQDPKEHSSCDSDMFRYVVATTDATYSRHARNDSNDPRIKNNTPFDT